MEPVNPEAWPLIRGRLRPPLQRGRAVIRQRINVSLCQAKDYEVIILAAPSGYGKTTSVTHWFQENAGRGPDVYAWVSLDEMDCDASRVLMYLLGGLSAADDYLAAALRSVSSEEFDVGISRPLQALLSVLEKFQREVFLVVDDLHGRLDKHALSIFARLANHGLGNLHVVLILRDAIDLPLARAKMRRTLLEVGPEQLQFNVEETRLYFELHEDLSVDEGQVKLLHERTDGWVAGLQLAMLSLRGRKDSAGFIDAFSGEHRDVADLLTEEVLGSLPASDVSFLEETSVLSSFSAELCDTIFERSDSAEVISRLVDGNFFIFPMDDERRFYRYHRLFAEYLRRALEQRNPRRPAETHRAAAAWFVDHGLPVRACLHASRSNDEAFLADVLEQVASALLEHGYGQTLIQYMSELNDDTIDGHPRLGVACAYVLTLTWRFDRASKLLKGMRARLTEQDALHGEVYADLLHREGQLALLRDNHLGALRSCSEWMQLDSSKTAFDEAVVRTSLICASAELYDFSELEQAASIREGFSGDEMAWATVWHDSIIGACYVKRAALGQARERFELALSTAENQRRKRISTPAMPAMHLAALEYEVGQIEAAQSLLDRYLATASELGMVSQLASGLITQAKIHRLLGNQDEALATLDTAEVQAARLGVSRLRSIAVYERMEILLASGFGDRVLALARSESIGKDPAAHTPIGSTSSADEANALAYILFCIAQNRLSDASDISEKWRKFTSGRGAYMAHCRFTVLALRISLLRGDAPKSARFMRELLELYSREGLMRSILDGGSAVIELLKSSEVDDERYSKARRTLLKQAGEEASKHSSDESVHSPAESLKGREAEILRLVEQGMMNKQIAAELGLTEGTVKWYMQQIFSKLGVRRRAQAIHKAKSLGLI